MKIRNIGLVFAAVSLAAANVLAQKPSPAATIRPVTDDYFGTRVVDNYRYMESLKDPQVQAWLKAQAEYTREELDALGTSRSKLLSRIQDLDNAIPLVYSWQRAGQSVFFLVRAPGSEVASLCVREEGSGDRTLLDPARFQEKGSHAAIDYFAPSYDGHYVLAGVSLGGSENSTIRIVM